MTHVAPSRWRVARTSICSATTWEGHHRLIRAARIAWVLTVAYGLGGRELTGWPREGGAQRASEGAEGRAGAVPPELEELKCQIADKEGRLGRGQLLLAGWNRGECNHGRNRGELVVEEGAAGVKSELH